ncbi:PAS domain S-box protein [Rubrolithibacter danxiaensis]|uniref:PAS domain-containing protein n=1 Tax=Rubrolithibacter danxiaensis TaxID=3390805 RepID=UPI003BF8CFE5
MQHITYNTFYEAIVENSTDLHAVLDTSGRYVYVGNSVFAMLGYTPDELIGTSAFDYIHPDDVGSAIFTLNQSNYQKLLHAPLLRMRGKNGTYKWIEALVSNMLDDPRVNGIVINSRDITDLIEANNQRRINHSYYYSLFLNHPDALFVLTPNAVLKKSNHNFFKITGFHDKEIRQHSLMELIHPTFREDCKAGFEQAVNGLANSTEVKLLTKDKREVYVCLTFIPIIIEEGIKEIQCTAKDVTAKYLYHLELKKLSLVASKTTNGVIMADAEGIIEFVNQSYCNLTGYSPDEMKGGKLGHLLTGRKFSDSEDTHITAYLENNKPEPIEILEYKKNGQEIWFLAEVSAVRNEKGEIACYIAILIDITEKKKNEIELLLLTKDLYKQNQEFKRNTPKSVGKNNGS